MSCEIGTQVVPPRISQAANNKRNQNIMLRKLNKKHAGFTLVEIMIVVAIIALLAAIAVPGFLRARKRSQASKILNDLRMIDAAVDQYRNRNESDHRVLGAKRRVGQIRQKRQHPVHPGKSLFGTDYGTQAVDTIPQVPTADLNVLSDVAGTGFWSPYGP